MTIDGIFAETNPNGKPYSHRQFVIIINKLSSSPQIWLIWQENCSKTLSGINTVGSGKGMRNFDQWTEELSKQIVIRADEQDTKTLCKADENLVNDDFEEEE